MPLTLQELASAAHLAGSLVLALFFALLSRHDPRRYLRDWTAAWLAQALALGALLAWLRGWTAAAGLYLLLETTYALLLWVAALNYARGLHPGRLHLLALLPAPLWAISAHALFPQPLALRAAHFALLGLVTLAAGTTLWRLREPSGMGLRLTTNVLGALGLLHLVNASVAWTLRSEAEPQLYLEAAPFLVLLLQMLLGLGMVLAVMEAAQWALAATNAQLKEAQGRLKTLAETDPLTGCFNRRVFRELVDDLRAGHGLQHGVVILVDMDGLKALNDSKGHAAGDDALRSMAEAIRSRTRDSDILVRWGGDEFVIVIPGTDREEGEARKDQVMLAIGETGLSASAGLATYDGSTDMLAAVDEADRVMYEIKVLRRTAG